MENRDELRAFLVSRRAKITPAQAKLPAYGGTRRVKGLRREEVAMLSGVSVDYYTKLERGSIGVVSDSVLDAVARTLQLTEAERDHLFLLAGSTGASRPIRRHPQRNEVRPALQRIIDGMTDSPAFIRTHTRDLVAANTLGRAVYAPLYENDTTGTPNTVRYLFLDDTARTFFADWPKAAADIVANLRTEIGRNPHDKDLTDLIDDLNRDSTDFRRLWKSHDVRYHDTGIKELHHPLVGDLQLTFEAMELPADPGLSLLVYGAEPNTATADALSLLGSWSSTASAHRPGSDTKTHNLGTTADPTQPS
jgi:transcriptional regulator with XRE-family HTH domain